MRQHPYRIEPEKESQVVIRPSKRQRKAQPAYSTCVGQKSKDKSIYEDPAISSSSLDKENSFGAWRMSYRANELKRLLGWLIAGTRGGVTRAKVIQTLRELPQNANQLATQLAVDYRTVRHHLKILEDNRIIVSTGEGYGRTYSLSPDMELSYTVFEEIWKKLVISGKGKGE